MSLIIILFFSSVLSPFKIIAGFGFLYQFIPLYLSGLRNSVLPLVGWIVVLALFINDGNLMRQAAIAEYAIVRVAEKSVKKNFEATVKIAKKVEELDGQSEELKLIEQKMDNCLSIAPTIAGEPNPEFQECQSDLESRIESSIASGKIKDVSVKGRLSSALVALGKGDIGSAAAETFNGIMGGVSESLMQIPTMIFAALRLIWLKIGSIALLVAVIALPFPLSFSFFNPQGLVIWHGSFWGAAFFTISMTVFIGILDYIESKIGAGLPTYWMQLGAAFVAPIISGLIAAGGGMAVVSAITKAASKVVEFGTKLAVGGR